MAQFLKNIYIFNCREHKTDSESMDLEWGSGVRFNDAAMH